MMKKAILVLMFVSSPAFAWNWQDPMSMFDATKNETNKVVVEWRQVDDVNASCNAERKKRGKGVFNFAVQGCSFWSDNACVILTPKQTNIANLGHETLHCFKGAYH